MSEVSGDFEYRRRRAPRRKRTASGDEFIENKSAELEGLEQAQRAGSVHCRGCHQRKAFSRVQFKYSLHNGDWIREWICLDCGTYIREDNLDTP